MSGFTGEQDLQRLREKMEKNRQNENQEMACRVALLTSLDCLDPDVPKQEEFVDWWKMKKTISLFFFSLLPGS